MDERSTIRDFINYLLDFNPEARIVNQLEFCWSDNDNGEPDNESSIPKEAAKSVTVYTKYMVLEKVGVLGGEQCDLENSEQKPET